jgi:hypothetical protein
LVRGIGAEAVAIGIAAPISPMAPEVNCDDDTRADCGAECCRTPTTRCRRDPTTTTRHGRHAYVH